MYDLSMNVLMGLLGCFLMGLVVMVVCHLVVVLLGRIPKAHDDDDDDFQFPDYPRRPL